MAKAKHYCRTCKATTTLPIGTHVGLYHVPYLRSQTEYAAAMLAAFGKVIPA